MKEEQTTILFALLSILLFSVLRVDGARPVLENTQYWSATSVIFNTQFRTLVTRLDFDEDLYVAADSFLCGKAEKACLPPSCTPCDWSGQDPEGCQNPNCCGPSEEGGEVLAKVDEWCGNSDTNTTNYTSLKFGEPSSTITLDEGETSYFRFFVGTENYCRPLKVVVKPFYGVPITRVSNLYAFPDIVDSEWKRGTSPLSEGLAQNYITICPVAHTNYRLGTYSIAVQAALASSFTVEVVVSSQSHPLLPPVVRLPCSSLPDDEYSEDAAETFCLEDGLTLSQAFPRNEYSEVIFPAPSGCSTISVSATLEDSTGEVDLFCLPRDPDQLTTRDNALIGRVVQSENRLSFSACFEEDITYVHCSVFPKTDAVIHVIFSTVSLPYRIPLQTQMATSLTYQDALTSASPVLFGVSQPPCVDAYSDCYEWVTAPSLDPLIFFPPPSELPLFNAPVDFFGEYAQAGLGVPTGRSLFVVVLLSVEEKRPYDEAMLMAEGSLAVLSITNQFGEVLDLPGGGVDVSTKKSVSAFIPHLPISSLSRIEVADFCDYQKYLTFQGLINDQIATIEEDNSIQTVQTVTYGFDLYNFALAGSSCLLSAIDNLESDLENVSRIDQTFCRYNQFEQPEQWELDPCCNNELSPVSCCFPFAVEVEETQFTSSSDLDDLCGIPECAASYYEDLTTALNQLNDPIQGCSSGIQDPEGTLAELINQQYERVIRDCLNDIGLGDDFTGTPCETDEDCEEGHNEHEHDHEEDEICDKSRKRCTIPDTAVMEHNYLTCYLDNMPSYLEDYIRREILPADEAKLPRQSEAFFYAVEKAASVVDCVDPNNALAIDKRARYVWDAELIECKAEQLGVPEDDLEAINEDCPPSICLGESCRENYGNCFANCNAEFRFQPTDEECAPEPICTVSDLDSCSGSHCVFCPNDHTFPCLVVPGVGEEECTGGMGCELPDGRVVFGLSEEDCRNTEASCTTNCPGEGCLSLSESAGVCIVNVNSLPTCQNVAKSFGLNTEWIFGDTCVIKDFETKAVCEEFETNTLLSVNWRRCEDVTAGGCGDENDSVQKYLQCFVSDWRECQNQEECEASGKCSDREFATIVRSETGEYPISLQTGACFNSGFDDPASDLPGCLEGMDRPGIGCRELSVVDDSDCEGAFGSSGKYSNREWVTPAFTENECKNNNQSRFGCLLSGPEKQLLWLDEEECECRGGSTQYAWEWNKGEWRGGTPRSLTWVEAETIPQYEVQTRLSFLELESWVRDSVEEQFLFILRSEVICQSNFISYSLTALVCDCFSEEENDDCYEQNENRENLVGVSAVCSEERSAVKGPSGRVTFSITSISEGCSLLNLSIVNQAWFDALVPDVAVSFRFQDHNARGAVRNSNQATVGELAGDGTVISFGNNDNLQSFYVCLRVVEGKGEGEYTVKDFGVSSSQYEYIEPLGLPVIQQQFESGTEFWCTTVTYEEVVFDKDGVVRLFPVYRKPDFKDEEEEYVSDQTEILMYTLGCFYAVNLILFLIYFVRKSPARQRGSKRRQIAFPLSILFSCLCVFRICFMFMYPNGVFYNEPLSEFVVFEIPTFLLFTMVIISIGFWKNLSNRTKFFMKDSTFWMYVGVVLVWCLWVVVTVVYSEVILETDSGASPCVGRVPDSNDELEDNTRVLSIVYQSIIISVTFSLAVIFLVYTKKLLSAAKNLSRVRKFILFIGGLITFTFLVRCVLFIIILAAQFTSSVYMFITLFLTEVLMMFLCALQFNQLFFSQLGGRSSGTTHGSSSRFGSVSQKSRRMQTDMSTVLDMDD